MTWLRKPVVLAILVAVVAVLVFAPALRGGWIYDDHPLIADNPYCHSFQWWPRWFVTDFWNVTGDANPSAPRLVYWRPLVTATYTFDWRAGGGSPWMFHVSNALMHAAVGGMAFVALRRWIGATLPSFAAALLFVVHPTKAESVAWISGRTDVLCMLMVLVTSQGIARRLRGQRGGLLFEVFGTLAAYACKEQSIVLPVFAAIEAWVFLERPPLDRPAITKLVRAALPQAAVAVAYLAIRAALFPLRSANLEGGIGLSDHIQSVLESFGRFIALTFAPHDLSTQHGLVQISGGAIAHSIPYMAIGIASVVAMVVTAVIARRRLAFVTVGLAFFLVTLAPTSNIVYTHLETLISERFLYLPVFGIAFVAGAALARWPRRSAYLVITLVVLAMSVLAARRASDYVDEQAFWARELALHPESPSARRAEINAAVKQKRYRAAVMMLLELTKSQVSYQDVKVAFELVQLLSSLTPDRDRQGLEALDGFCKDLLARKEPEATIAISNLTFTIPTTTKTFEKHIRNFRLQLIMQRATLRNRLGDDTGAVELASGALRECPTCSPVVTTGALVLARGGLYDDAVAILDAARGHVPDDVLEAAGALVRKARDAHVRSQSLAGAAQLQARASELTTLELWGRAYDLLAPHKDEIKLAPKVVVGFAELAFRAGDAAVAREVLAGVLPPAEIEQRIAEWAFKMGWSG